MLCSSPQPGDVRAVTAPTLKTGQLRQVGLRNPCMLNQTAVSGNRRHFQWTFTNTDTRTRKGEILQGHTHHRYTGQEHRGKRRRQHRMRKREEGPRGFAPGPRITGPALEEGPGAAPPDLQKCVGNAMSIFCRLPLMKAPEHGQWSGSYHMPESGG